MEKIFVSRISSSKSSDFVFFSPFLKALWSTKEGRLLSSNYSFKGENIAQIPDKGAMDWNHTFSRQSSVDLVSHKYIGPFHWSRRVALQVKCSRQ